MTGSFTFDSVFPDGSPRRMAGTWRPPREDADRLYRDAPPETMITSMKHGDAPDFATLNWQKGNMDRPLYHVEDWERT